MPTLQRTLSVSADDAEELDDGTDFSSVTVRIDCDSNAEADSRFNGGLRFTNITIPPGSTIVSATCRLEIPGAAADDPHLDIHCEDVDDAVDFAATADVTSRARTPASTAWDATGLGIGPATTPDFAAALQQVIDRGSWASGNAVVILLVGKTTPDATFRFESADDAGGVDPILDIEYTEPSERSVVLNTDVLRVPDTVTGY